MLSHITAPFCYKNIFIGNKKGVGKVNLEDMSLNFTPMCMKIKLILILTLSFIFNQIVLGRDYILKENIPYHSFPDIELPTEKSGYQNERCKLDIYYSPEFKDKPVVVWFHGGGLIGGEKFVPQELQNDSLVIVAVNYRLLPKATIDECIDDAAAAVAWTFNNISEYGGSKDKIFVAGHSAGGYLLSMIGFEKKWLEKYGIDSDSIAGLFPYSGQALTHYAVREINGISPLEPRIDEYSPLFHARKDCPPYIIISGDRNQELYGRYEENAYLWRLMKLLGHPEVYLYELDGFDHGAMAVPAHHILKKHINQLLSTSGEN